MSGTKRCTSCGETKPVDQFHRRAASADGRQPKCKPCALAADANRRATRARTRARVTTRGGRHRLPRGDTLDVTCWCELVVIPVPRAEVHAGLTRSCGAPECRRPDPERPAA